MEKLKDSININTILWLVGLIFIAGGGWYALQVSIPAQVDSITEKVDKHIEKGYEPLELQVTNNSLRITSIESETIQDADLSDFVTVDNLDLLRAQNAKDLVSVKELVREIQNSQNNQLQRMNDRLDYIIRRLDDER